MATRQKKILFTLLRWTVAVVGIALVFNSMQLRDTVLLLDDSNTPVKVVLDHHTAEDNPSFVIRDPDTGDPREVLAEQLVNPPDRENVRARLDGELRTLDLLGLRVVGDINKNPDVTRLLVRDDATGKNVWINQQDVPDGFKLNVPKPKVQSGLIAMVQAANPWLLLASLAVFPVTFLMTTLRWWRLLNAVGVRMTLGRAFVINVVGCFYNSFALGTMGGDVVKAIYAARHSDSKTPAVLSVMFDRAIGLLTLVIIGGLMSAWQVLRSGDVNDPTAAACLQVALISAIVLMGFLFVFSIVLHPAARKSLKIDLLLSKLPLKNATRKVIETMEIYRRRPGLILWAVLATVPVHTAVIVSAMLAGAAFDLPISYAYYFVVVPVVVLVGAIPISPQGAGVMEFFAIMLTARQGATVSEAFALTMSIRVVQILWNLIGGIWVIRGGFSAPTAAEEQQFEDDVEDEAVEIIEDPANDPPPASHSNVPG